MRTIIRQGDVYLIPARKPWFPFSWRLLDQHGFRHEGENGDHAHVMGNIDIIQRAPGFFRRRFDRLFSSDPRTLLHLKEPRVLEHVALRATDEEPHNPVEVPGGWWRPRIQRQRSGNGVSRRTD